MTFDYIIKAIDERLNLLINECSEDALREAMAYSLFAGGKRIRPMLLLATAEAAWGIYDTTALDFACAAEMIHTYSLIHDDLPAMDDDDYRRGHLTCHKKFGEAAAILAGDGLLSHAFEIMSRICENSRSMRPSRAMGSIARAVGINGMVAGQISDMLNEHKDIDASTLISIHNRKTAGFISACMEAGAILGNGTGAFTKKAARLGRLAGLAFQICDDILDVTATSGALGKPAGSDAKNHKNTYVSLMGAARAQTEYLRLQNEAQAVLAGLPQKSDMLNRLITRIFNRVN